MIYIDSQGFHKKTLAEIRRELEAFALGSFGAGIDLAPTGPLGMMIAGIAKYIADGWEGAQEIVTSRDPDTATGVQLDEICAETGVYRLPATPARVDDVLIWATWATAITVPTGSKAKSATQTPSYSLESDAVFSGSATGPFRGARLELSTALYGVGITISIVVNGNTYTETVGSGDTEIESLEALATTINTGEAVSIASYESVGGAPHLRLSADSFTLGAFSSHLIGRQAALAGVFLADVAGIQAVPALTLDTILTPVAGWLAVEQPADGIDGTDVETDTALRIRRLKGLRSGTATEDAIREALYRVTGVSQAIVASNRTMTTDAESRPPKSFEAIVTGGSDPLVAKAIWDTMPAGIEPYGQEFAPPGYAVIGTDGEIHYVNWSRPDPVYAWVEVTIVTMDPDGAATGDYEQAIRDAVAAYGNENFGLGDNYKLQKFYAPVYSVPGIYSVTLRIATTATEGGPATYGTSNVAVASREYLTFNASRVVVLP